MSDLLWILLKVSAAVILAARVLRDFRHTAEQYLPQEDKENTRKPELPDANDDNSNH